MKPSSKALRVAPDGFRPWKLFRGFEGGAIYTAKGEGRFFVIIDERTTATLLSDEDAADVDHLEVHGFDTLEERAAYLQQLSCS